MYKHTKNILETGVAVNDAKKAIIMLHGRGASATDIVSLQKHLQLHNTAIIAPQASNNSWYPYSFLVAEEQNQPALDSALILIENLVIDMNKRGITSENIYFLGFSQGACLSLEYTARNAQRYGGVIAFTGGLIGATLNLENYQGNFNETPVLITTGDPDPHVPLARVRESAELFTKLNAAVILKVFEGRPHMITSAEIDLANQLILT